MSAPRKPTAEGRPANAPADTLRRVEGPKMLDSTLFPQQQQQQPQPGPVPVRVFMRYMVPDDQRPLLPRRPRAPSLLPPEVPRPQRGDVVYLSSSSAWGVELVVYDWHSPVDLLLEVWLTHVGSSRARRATGFGVTQ